MILTRRFRTKSVSAFTFIVRVYQWWVNFSSWVVKTFLLCSLSLRIRSGKQSTDLSTVVFRGSELYGRKNCTLCEGVG